MILFVLSLETDNMVRVFFSVLHFPFCDWKTHHK